MGKALSSIAMIAVAVFAPYAAAALGLTGFAATAFSFVLQAAAGSIFGPKAQGGGGVTDSGMLVNKQGNVSAIPVVYGSRRVGGTRIYVDSTDASGAISGDQYLHVVLAIAQGGVVNGDDAIKSINTIYFNNRVAWTSSGGVDSYFSGLLNFAGWLGKGNQTVTAPDYNTEGNMDWLSDDWTTNHRCRGVAFAYFRLKYNRDKYSGAPTITFDITGKKLRRVDTLSYSTSDAELKNPANIIYDYLTSARYGKGISDSDLDLASFQEARTWATAANIEFNGAVETSDTIYNNLQRLLLCANMNLVFINGKYSVKPIKQESFTGVFDFNTSNILGKLTMSLGSKKTRFNTVKINYFNPDLDWQTDSLMIEDAAYLAADSDVVNEKSIDLPFCSSQTLAERVGRFYLDLSRYQTVVSFKSTWSALQLQVGDPVTVTHATPNWSGKQFRVNSITLQADSTVDVVLEEYMPDAYYLE